MKIDTPIYNPRHMNPTATGRWGFLLFVCLLTMGLAGCGGSPAGTPCGDPSRIVYSAATDSLGLEEYQALSAASRSARRSQAGNWRRRASTSTHPRDRLRALQNAVGLAPDDPDSWLRLAHQRRWLGDYLGTLDCLEAASLAVRDHDPGRHRWDKLEMQRRVAVARAWLHHDRGEWQDGLRWARSAMRLEPGDEGVRQIYGLLAGRSGLRSEALQTADGLDRAEHNHTDAPWIRASYRISTHEMRQAFNLILDLNPNREHQSECWRELGELAEKLGEHSRAGRWYTESIHSLPLPSLDCVSSQTLPRLRPGSRRTHQKVWLAFDRFYVSGSLSAYVRLALERFDAATETGAKDFWAGQVVDAAGTLLRRKIDEPWAYRARGLVFAYFSDVDRGIRDLHQASIRLEKLGRGDGRIEATVGRLLLEKKDHVQALPHLRKASHMSSEEASVWRDLGLALIMDEQNREAEQALGRSIELDPESPTAWYNRGLLHLHEKNYGPAVGDLEQAARLAPGNQEVIQLLQKAKGLARRQPKP